MIICILLRDKAKVTQERRMVMFNIIEMTFVCAIVVLKRNTIKDTMLMLPALDLV